MPSFYMINPKQGRSPESGSWHSSSFRSCWLPTHRDRHECSPFVQALQVQHHSHLSLTAQHNSFDLPPSSVKYSFLLCCFLICPYISGRPGQIGNEWSTKTECSFHSDARWESSARFGSFRESSKVTGSTWSCESQRETPEHLLHWTFKKKPSWAVAKEPQGKGLKIK